MKHVAIAAMAAFAISSAMAGEYHPVSWYVNHPAEARATLAWCQDNLGVAKHVANCENALQARNTHSWQSLQAMFPPNDSVERWRNDPIGRGVQIATCRNMTNSHTPMPPDMTSACAAAKAAD